MKESLYGELSVIGMHGCEQFVEQVDSYLREWRRHDGESSFLVEAPCPRFGTRLELPDGLTSIGEYAFAYCTGITGMELPDSVTGIDWNSFYNCTKL
ncbi:MAG: leucine-rich repeat protein, partial [Clostridia bacterium]|nr:leucine-rich repeat protein [Clostridia bacterium]